MRKRSLILLSGGLDSSANLAFCHDRDEPVLAITADYGQRAAAREIEASVRLCQAYGVPHRVVDLGWLGGLGKSSLTDSALKLPAVAASDLENRAVTSESARSVWVPNRNGVLLNVAAAHAEAIGAEQVVVGFNREEAATFPDNSAEFLSRATRALEYSTRNHVLVACYTLDWDKRTIVSELRKLKRAFPLELVWSCYQGGSAPCRECESCQRFLRAVSA